MDTRCNKENYEGEKRLVLRDQEHKIRAIRRNQRLESRDWKLSSKGGLSYRRFLNSSVRKSPCLSRPILPKHDHNLAGIVVSAQAVPPMLGDSIPEACLR